MFGFSFLEFSRFSPSFVKLPRATVNHTDEEKTTMALEGHLEQLLICQEKQRTLDLVRRQQQEEEVAGVTNYSLARTGGSVCKVLRIIVLFLQ